MAEPPVGNTHTLLHFVDGSLAWAGHCLHEDTHPVHTHSFFEIAVVTGGAGAHYTLAGTRELRTGDVMIMRPGVWHG
jgi:AraC family L-rhamnose operon transcriptional activator RhaR